MKCLIVLDRKAEMDGEDIPYARVKIDGEEYLFCLVDFPEPDLKVELEENAVLVKIKAFSCNYRDKGILSMFREKCANSRSGDSFSYGYFGSDFVGEVIGIGKNVRAFKVGDRVIPDDSYPRKTDDAFGGVATNDASNRIQVFRESFLVKVPDSMSDYQAACFPLTALTSSSIISKANIKAKDKVLVTAPFSNTSMGCLEFLRHRNDVEVYALSTHKQEAEVSFKGFNLRQVFSLEELLQEEVKPHLLFDVIIDPFADIHLNTLSGFLNHNARYISCGYTNTAIERFDPRNVLLNFIAHNAVFIGNCLGHPGALKTALSAFERNEYSVYIDSVFSGEQVSSFVERSFNERHFGKVLYVYDD